MLDILIIMQSKIAYAFGLASFALAYAPDGTVTLKG